MIRHIDSFASLSSLASVMGPLCACDQPGMTERQKENQATEQAATAQNQAAQQAQAAQATADKDRATAQLNFEKAREDYRHTRRQDLTDLDKEIVNIEAKAQKAQGKSRTDLQQALTDIRAQRDAFVRHLQSIDSAAANDWDAAKANLDKEWESLKSRVDSAS